MSKSEQTSPEIRQESLSDAHLDIGLGNNYRIEYIKHLVSIATGVFVFSVTFMKDLINESTTNADWKPFLIAGWTGLVVSIVSGILHMRLWSQYYISWGLHYEESRAVKWRQVINRRRKIAENLQIGGFAIGLLLLLIFATRNLMR